MSRILIDGRFIGVGESISRYTLELLKNLLEIDKENEYTLLVRSQGVDIAASRFGFQIDKSENEKLIVKWEMINGKYQNLKIKILDVAHYSFGEQTKFLSFLNKEKYDLVHFTQFNHPMRYGGKFVVTIHDLILLNHAKANLIKKMAFWPVLKSCIKAEKIITISDESKREIIYSLHVRDDKVMPIYLGINHRQFNVSAKSNKELLTKFCQKNKITDDYFLYVGAWKSHKNILGLLKEYEDFILSGERFLHLVLVGKVDLREKRVILEIEKVNKKVEEDKGKKGAVVTAGVVDSDEELSAIYGGAIAYIMPSLAEGFGWPPLEAMACSTPVISSNKSCMPEILGEAALYFDPTKNGEMKEAIQKIIHDHTLRENLIKKGLSQVEKYNWSETAKKTLEVYKSVLE